MTNVEKLEAELRVARAKERLDNVVTELPKLLEELSGKDTAEAVKAMASFVARVNNSKKVIRESQTSE